MRRLTLDQSRATPRRSFSFFAFSVFSAVGLTTACAARPEAGAPATPETTAPESAKSASAPPATLTTAATPPHARWPGETRGGNGGAIIKVTRLDREGPGTLSHALAQKGPRMIVFEVGGVIDMDRQGLSIDEPFVTVAGQTAPSPGVTIIRGGLRVRTHDVVLQHLRFRMGDAGAAAGSGFEPDVATHGADAHHIVFDHCSVAWGVDENLSVSGPRHDGPSATSRQVVIRHSIIAEGLRNSVHEKGKHSMGTLVHDHCTDVAVVGNLYAHNDERNPWFKGHATGVVVNNLIYNPGRWAIRLGPVLKEWTEKGVVPEPPRVSIVGNVLRHGADTGADVAMIGSNSSGTAYLDDNVAWHTDGAPALLVAPEVQQLPERVAWIEGLSPKPASSVEEWVLDHAGARPKERDSVDLRIVASVRERSGRLIDSQSDVGGYPAAAASERRLDVPAEGVEQWLDDLARALE